jgi:hypothetical protein
LQRAQGRRCEGGFLEIRFHSRDTCSIGGACVLGWQASWAAHLAMQLGPRTRVGRWASRVEKGEEGQATQVGWAEMEEGLGSGLNGI